MGTNNKKPANTIKVMLEMPIPEPKPLIIEKASAKEPSEPKESVEDKVKAALECIDSGYDSNVEWSMINRLYRDLKALKKPNDRAKNLVNMIEPVLAKFGYFGKSGNKFNGV